MLPLKLLTVVAALLVAFQAQSTRWVHQIPDGFTGFVMIAFSAPGGQTTFREDALALTFEGDRLFRIPLGGVLLAAEPVDRRHGNEYVLTTHEGTSKRLGVVPISSFDDVADLQKITPVVISLEAQGHVGYPPGCDIDYFSYYVGTLAEARRQLDRHDGSFVDTAQLELVRKQFGCSK